jgi:hypothetical protein
MLGCSQIEEKQTCKAIVAMFKSLVAAVAVFIFDPNSYQRACILGLMGQKWGDSKGLEIPIDQLRLRDYEIDPEILGGRDAILVLFRGVGDGSEQDPSRLQDDIDRTMDALLRGDDEIPPSAKHLEYGFEKIRLFLAARSMKSRWIQLNSGTALNLGFTDGLDVLDLEGRLDIPSIPKDAAEPRRLVLRIRYDAFGAFMRTLKLPQEERMEFYKTGRVSRSKDSILNMVNVGTFSRDQRTFVEVFSYSTSAPYDTIVEPATTVARCVKCGGHFKFQKEGAFSNRQITGPRNAIEAAKRQELRDAFFEELDRHHRRADRLLTRGICACSNRDLDPGNIAPKSSSAQGGQPKSDDLPAKLRELTELFNSGALNAEQFETAKNRILGL